METWFRLRHLQSVSGKNINVPIKDLNCNYIFFALSTTDKGNLGYFYRSSNCDNLLNPFWENIDLSYDNIKSCSFLNNFLITFFLTKKNKNKILLEIKIHISGLILLSKLNPDNVENDNQSFQFQLNNNWYSFDLNSSENNFYPNLIDNNMKIRKKLYNIDTINKFLGFIADDYNQQLFSAQEKLKDLENKIFLYKNNACRISQKNIKVIAIKNQILFEQKKRNQKLKTLSDIKKSNDLTEQKTGRTQEFQERTEIDIVRQSTHLKRFRDAYLKISNDYMLRMYQLIHELSKIFPITLTDVPNQVRPDGTNQNTVIIRSTDKLSICNLHLPNNDKQITLNQDNVTFAALGMVCQLLTALSKIYDIPLRYPITSEDPKLSIRDEIIDIDDSDRSFLLVKSASPSFRLQYAIYLLNLNISAIRGYFSLSTKSPERTLWNINSLIEGKNKTQNDMGSSNNLINNSSDSNTQDVNSPTYSRPNQSFTSLVSTNSPTKN